MNRALIIGASGQDGTLLADLLKTRRVDFIGLTREGLVESDGKLTRPGRLTDPAFIGDVVKAYVPTRVFYLAAHHHSSQQANLLQDPRLWEASLNVQVLGLVNVLDALRQHSPGARLFYAASSHIYGSPGESPQNEDTPLLTTNVYGVTKIMGIEACDYFYRQHGVHASVGILYNHESVYRKPIFLSQKIIRGALDIKRGRARRLTLGDLSAEVDWGYAPDYVDAMVRILEVPKPGRYVIATGTRHSVREFVDVAFRHLGLDYRDHVTEDPSLIQKSQNRLVGDASKLRRDTGWAPSVSFPEMIRLLVTQTERRDPHE